MCVRGGGGSGRGTTRSSRGTTRGMEAEQSGKGHPHLLLGRAVGNATEGTLHNEGGDLVADNPVLVCHWGLGEHRQDVADATWRGPHQGRVQGCEGVGLGEGRNTSPAGSQKPGLTKCAGGGAGGMRVSVWVGAPLPYRC